MSRQKVAIPVIAINEYLTSPQRYFAKEEVEKNVDQKKTKL